MPWKKLELPTADERREMDEEYRGKARSLVDESIGANVAEYLSEKGYNTRYAGDEGLEGHSDEDVFAFAWKSERIIVTHDADFLDDRRFPPHRNPGIVLIRPGSSGRDDYGLLVCLYKATVMAGDHAQWFERKKLDFSSRDLLIITSPGTRQKYLWERNRDVMIWED
jgi:predicted nuclease of predicted toxin-antitoxin system